MSLPRDETTFFGRQAESHEIARRFESGTRLLTIVGLGGVGKTRLAVTFAEGTEPALFVALGEARTLEAAVREVAAAARVALKADSGTVAALGVLAAALSKKGRALLVLDNTEQLGPAARELVVGLLDGARELRILATAREPIGARGEEKLVLAPLEEGEAVALLRDRARLAGAVEIDQGLAAAIVRKVDRLPLAIELGASRLEMLSPAELLERLSERLDILADASGAAAPAHRTMRATLEWSWDLLSPAERDALVQASVFAAPFGIEAAEEILALREGEVLDVLESLVKRSLLVRTTGADRRVRLTMFETVRTWAREKQADASVRVRHAQHHRREAERAAAEAYGERAVAALDTLQALLPELLVAFDATETSEPALAARLVLALTDLLLFRRLFDQRVDLFSRAVVAAERAQDEALLARMLVAKARVTLEDGGIQDAETELRRAIELAERTGDDVTRAEATRSLGWAFTALGRADDAMTTLTDAQSSHRTQGSARGLADAHVALGILHALQGRSADGLAELREALAIHVEHGDVIRQEKVLGFGGLVGHDAREIARGLPREVLARAPRSSIDVLPAHVAELVAGERAAGERWQDAIALYRQGATALDRGDPRAAVTFFDRALAGLERAGVKKGLAAIHAHAAAALAAEGDPREAKARLERARIAVAADPAADLVVAVFAMAVELIAGTAAPGQARALFERATRAEVSTPELSLAAHVLERVLSGGAMKASPSGAAAFGFGRDSRSMTPPHGERVDLVRYGPVRRLLERLVVARLEAPGTALSAEALIEAGWPGERMRHSAGLLRVYSAVRRLRRLGLEPILVTRDDGYLLDPNAAVRRDEDA